MSYDTLRDVAAKTLHMSAGVDVLVALPLTALWSRRRFAPQISSFRVTTAAAAAAATSDER